MAATTSSSRALPVSGPFGWTLLLFPMASVAAHFYPTTSPEAALLSGGQETPEASHIPRKASFEEDDWWRLVEMEVCLQVEDPIMWFNPSWVVDRGLTRDDVFPSDLNPLKSLKRIDVDVKKRRGANVTADMSLPERVVFVSGLWHGHGGAHDGTLIENSIMSSGDVLYRQLELCSNGGGAMT